jgi:Mlc titration factor MtfA (ptsG expression regulator)/Tfp pilus assembly protein PilF
MFFSSDKRARRQKLAGQLPAASREYIRQNVLLARVLPPAGQARLLAAAAVLAAEKNWEGCAGLAMTDEIKLTIAAQAAVLLLGLDDYAFDELGTVLVYPGGFLTVPEDELGGRGEAQLLLGQAAAGGPVMLSWWHARWGGRRLGPVNVVFHEFAHKLAELGEPDRGCPPLVDAGLRRRWDRVMGRALDRLAEDADYGRPTLLDPYGAESPAEFFAVATETFFLRPAEMRRRHPDVYELLAGCYRQDPARWPLPPAAAEEARGEDQEYSRQAVRECTQALAHRPDFAEAYRERAEHLLALGDPAGAVADWDAVLRLAGDEEERADAHFARAQALRQAGRDAEALHDLDALLALHPDSGGALVERAALHAGQRDRAAARRDLDLAVRLDPRDDGALLARAALDEQDGQLPRARKDLHRAAGLRPHDPAVFRRLARVHQRLGDPRRALAAAREAARLAPEDEENVRLLAEVSALRPPDEAD